MKAALYIVRDRGTRLHYVTGKRPARRDGGVDFVGMEARLTERGGVDRIEPVDVWPLMRSLPSGDAEYFEAPPTWAIDHDVRKALLDDARGGDDD